MSLGYLLVYFSFIFIFICDNKVFSANLHYHNRRSVEKKCTDNCVQDKVFPGMMLLLIFLLVLFLMGLIKGIIGLLCSRKVGMFGLNVLLDLPHPITSYYELDLRCYRVVYDDEGWPVDPRNLERRTRIINESSELCLNVVFFFAFPAVVIWVALQSACGCYDNNCNAEIDCYDHRKYRTNENSNGGRINAHEKIYVKPCRKQNGCSGQFDGQSSFIECQKPSCSRKRGGLDMYYDGNDSTEDEDTKYVFQQLCKSERSLKQSAHEKMIDK